MSSDVRIPVKLNSRDKECHIQKQRLHAGGQNDANMLGLHIGQDNGRQVQSPRTWMYQYGTDLTLTGQAQTATEELMPISQQLHSYTVMEPQLVSLSHASSPKPESTLYPEPSRATGNLTSFTNAYCVHSHTYTVLHFEHFGSMQSGINA